jgi:hypothetical protein
MCARSTANYMLSWPSPGPMGRRHEAHRRASHSYVEGPEAPGRIRGGPSSVHQNRYPNFLHTLRASKCCENWMCARSLVNYMRSWPSPGPIGRRHEAHKRASDPYVEATNAPGGGTAPNAVLACRRFCRLALLRRIVRRILAPVSWAVCHLSRLGCCFLCRARCAILRSPPNLLIRKLLGPPVL